MQSKAAYWTCTVLGALFLFIAARQILHYGQGDGAWPFIFGILLPFSAGFGFFLLAEQYRRRGSRNSEK